MTELERTNPPPENEDVSETPPAEPALLLRRAVLWLAVVAFLYAAGCAAGVFFGVVYYRVVQADRSLALHALAFIVERVMLLGACISLGRALWRYARALERPDGDAAPVGPTMLAARQLSCWQALIWVALLYAGWEMTIAFMGSQ